MTPPEGLPKIHLPEVLSEVLEKREDLRVLLDKHLADAEAFYDVFCVLVREELKERGGNIRAAEFQAAHVLPKGIYDQIKYRLH